MEQKKTALYQHQNAEVNVLEHDGVYNLKSRRFISKTELQHSCIDRAVSVCPLFHSNNVVSLASAPFRKF
jgi:hypothetical protein